MTIQRIAQPRRTATTTTTTEETPRPCAGCGEMAGSISQGSGFPVVRDRESGLYFHVKCRPGTPSGVAAVAFATF